MNKAKITLTQCAVLILYITSSAILFSEPAIPVGDVDPERDKIAKEFIKSIDDFCNERAHKPSDDKDGEYLITYSLKMDNTHGTVSIINREQYPDHMLELLWWRSKNPNARLLALAFIILSDPTDITNETLASFVYKSTKMSEAERSIRWKEIGTFSEYYRQYAKSISRLLNRKHGDIATANILAKINDSSQTYPSYNRFAYVADVMSKLNDESKGQDHRIDSQRK
jgi:hypothetical protein